MKEIISTGGKIWRIALCVLVPLMVGGLSALLTAGAMGLYGVLSLPPLAPPVWVFPVVWMILYVLMGVASWLIYQAGAKGYGGSYAAKDALKIYAGQLVMNFFWPIIFFSMGWHWFAFAWLIVMWTMIIALMVKTWGISKAAFWCLVPYAVWCTFAAYLNAGVAVLN